MHAKNYDPSVGSIKFGLFGRQIFHKNHRMERPLEAYLRQHMEKHGPMPFDRFMEAALYHPDWGYYESVKTVIGRKGDFQTSVSVGSLFGELLARTFLSWQEREEPCQWMECGAHHGQLAEDILGFLDKENILNTTGIQYFIFEPSSKRDAIQQKRLNKFKGKVTWLRTWEEVKDQFEKGVIFSNELMDAFPVKRFAWNKQEACWKECTVVASGNSFDWTQIKLDTTLKLPWLTAEDQTKIESLLPDQYIIECAPAADAWWRQAASVLREGHLITLDYGFTDLEKFSPRRTKGTLRTYDRHRLGEDVLIDVGEKDLTAHVDFTSLQKIGEGEGLETVSMISQEKFMHGCLERMLTKGVNPSPDQIRQFQTLMHPEHFGRAFKVLIQRRPPNSNLTGLTE